MWAEKMWAHPKMFRVKPPPPPLQKMTNFAVVVDITYARGGKWLENKE